ncbi:MAG: hypothetical protein ACXACB_01870 [Promethearchaeota archaeon]|jgi:uncharacterized Zn-finger protein
MVLKDLLKNEWLVRIILISWIITAALAFFMIVNLDLMIHGTLYDFGLQFSNQWADPYWTQLYLSFAFLGASSVLSFFALLIGFFRSKQVVVEPVNIPEKHVKQKIVDKRKIGEKKPKVSSRVVRSDKGNMIISCPNCKKVFKRPMVMLNFEGGKTRLVNVCPYCNHGLGEADNNGKSNTEFHIQGQDESEQDQKLERS